MLKLYDVLVKFFEPTQGVVTIEAETPEGASVKAKELFNNMKDVDIVQVYETKQIPLMFDAKELN